MKKEEHMHKKAEKSVHEEKHMHKKHEKMNKSHSATAIKNKMARGK